MGPAGSLLAAPHSIGMHLVAPHSIGMGDSLPDTIPLQPRALSQPQSCLASATDTSPAVQCLHPGLPVPGTRTA